MEDLGYMKIWNVGRARDLGGWETGTLGDQGYPIHPQFGISNIYSPEITTRDQRPVAGFWSRWNISKRLAGSYKSTLMTYEVKPASKLVCICSNFENQFPREMNE